MREVDRGADGATPIEGRRRVVITAVTPEVEHGRFPVKRTVGEVVDVEADVFADGHERLRVVLRHRAESEDAWREEDMVPLVNDRWRGRFTVDREGRHQFGVVAWIDRFATWSAQLAARVTAGQDVTVDLEIGSGLVASAASRARGNDAAALNAQARALAAPDGGPAVAASAELAALMRRYDDRPFAVTYERELPLVVERERARFSTWYELFPRSAGAPGQHGTFADVARRLPLVARLGFDVLYLPPIHPIGATRRRGPNNTEASSPDDPGSPWAIGSDAGGHDAIHPALGTLADLDRLVAEAKRLGIEIALDLAVQCSPDHPYVRDHPEWFRHLPDGSIRHAENPPKRYWDIYPIDFETEDRQALWHELLRVVRFWTRRGVRIFRVDNPHTKPFAFWEWLIGEVKREDPGVLFLSEAFTRPKPMYRLAQLGFSQSYTYFTWRTTKRELTDYFTELTLGPAREWFRPNLWPNTPDILTEQLQFGGRPAFIQRLVLAATLGASYGIYGPPFELCEARAVRPGSEEYLDSEKYQLRHWDWDERAGIREIVALVNRIRRDHPALQTDRTLRFHPTDSEAIIAYSKRSADGQDVMLMVVSLDPHQRRSTVVDLRLDELGLPEDETYQVHDLLGGARYIWRGARNYVELDPASLPAHVFAVRRRVRTERDFDYYL